MMSLTPRTYHVHGSAPVFHWPAQGQAAVTIPAITPTVLEATPNEHPIPIASLAKLMTAYLVLEHHPLTAGSAGPTLTISAADERQYYVDVAEDQSSVQVATGEKLSEFQLLQALLIRSANNVAQLLATWVAGSQTAFVAQMNHTASRLGLVSAHFADASGFNPATKATARDMATIAALDMRNPIFAQLVDAHSVTLPLVGTVPNIVARIATANIVGIKSGYTIWSGGCAAIATQDSTAAGEIGAVAVVLDQQGPSSLHHAASIAEELADEVHSGVIKATVAHANQLVGVLRIPWSSSTPSTQHLVLAHALNIGLWPGQSATYRLVPALHGLSAASAPGTVAGYLQIDWPMHTERIPVLTTEYLPQPSMWWRLLHG
jgi:D-alanyl-D-alanine carboxypeptidase (penicillin-binding protein 5/6)